MVEEIDSKSRLLVNDKMDALSCYLFISWTTEQRNEAIAHNRLQNVRMKHKVIKNTHVKEMVKMNRDEMAMGKALSRVEVNNEVIF